MFQMTSADKIELNKIQKVLEVVAKLRDPNGGCPWDLEQNHKSLLPFLIEESYEFSSAVESNDISEMEEEIGDVLLQVLLHSKIASEKNNFNFSTVCEKLSEKLIRRHPHVFTKKNPDITVDQLHANWEEIKKSEGKVSKSRISFNSLNNPPLKAAFKIGAKTNKLNFDWDNHSQVKDKVEEEWNELNEALVDYPKSKKEVKEELGDLLFSIAQLGRHLDICPDEALKDANKKFLTRFHSMESIMEEDNKQLEDLTQKQMEEYWKKVKVQEKNN
jgi:MazG family protein